MIIIHPVDSADLKQFSDDLAKECNITPKQQGEQNLSRIEKGLQPGTSKHAVEFNKQKEKELF